MRGVIRWLGRLVLMMVAAVAGLWALRAFGPDGAERSGDGRAVRGAGGGVFRLADWRRETGNICSCDT